MAGCVVAGYTRANVSLAGGIYDYPVPRAIAVQVRIKTALHSGVFRRFESVGAGNIPVPDHVLHQPVTVLEWSEFINRREREALATVKRGTRPIRFEILEILGAA